MFHHQIFGFLLIVLQVLASIIDYEAHGPNKIVTQEITRTIYVAWIYYMRMIEWVDGF